MKNLDMIETQGGGIRKLFNFQKQRFFQCPILILVMVNAKQRLLVKY